MNKKSPLARPLSFPSPFRDTALYANKIALKNRLAILQRYKLTQQQRIDVHSMKKIFTVNNANNALKGNGGNKPAIVKWTSTTVFAPGDIDQSYPEARPISAYMYLPDLHLSSVQEQRLKMLVGPERYDAERRTVKLTCSDFPFSTQNKAAVRAQIKELLKAVKDEGLAETFNEQPFDASLFAPKKRLTVPDAWLVQKQENETEAEAETKIRNRPSTTLL